MKNKILAIILCSCISMPSFSDPQETLEKIKKGNMRFAHAYIKEEKFCFQSHIVNNVDPLNEKLGVMIALCNFINHRLYEYYKKNISYHALHNPTKKDFIEFNKKYFNSPLPG